MYCLGDEQLLFSDSEVDLGILLSPNLTWSNQVNKVRSKANRMIVLIRRSTLEMTVPKQKNYCIYTARTKQFSIRIPGMVPTIR